MLQQEPEQLAAGVAGGADDGDLHRAETPESAGRRTRRRGRSAGLRDGLRPLGPLGDRLPHDRQQPSGVPPRVVRRQAEAGRDVVLAHLVVGGGAGDGGDRQAELAPHQLGRAPAGHRIGRRHDVRRADPHQLRVAQDVLHAVLAQDAVAQLGDDHVRLAPRRAG